MWRDGSTGPTFGALQDRAEKAEAALAEKTRELTELREALRDVVSSEWLRLPTTGASEQTVAPATAASLPLKVTTTTNGDLANTALMASVTKTTVLPTTLQTSVVTEAATTSEKAVASPSDTPRGSTPSAETNGAAVPRTVATPSPHRPRRAPPTAPR